MANSLGSSVVVRKARRLMAVPRRGMVNLFEQRECSRPPIVANSVPKSGTHLLLQILESLPGVRPWGLFLASQPSFRFRNVPPGRLAAKVGAMADGELAGAHLHFSEELAGAFELRGVAPFFIYRDPRDVVVSEAHYLATMNRWHRLHPYFRHAGDLQAKIRLSIEGLPPEAGLDYPDIGQRYARFLGWLDNTRVCAVRYEALMGADRPAAVARIVEFWCSRTSCGEDAQALVAKALDAVRPAESHTFRQGGSGGWREAMEPSTRACFLRHGERIVHQLGYGATE